MKYPVIVHQSKYGYDVRCLILPGCHSQGDTRKEALENIKDAIQTYLEIDASELKDSKLYQIEVGV
ncbi:MAG: type II toxin-antitoxin system HicB family antitoxin [bacterium]|nr:type II toxin-antitoxin system HicB family antitoxin [bacterium]